VIALIATPIKYFKIEDAIHVIKNDPNRIDDLAYQTGGTGDNEYEKYRTLRQN
jgi:hypothetical protein